MRSDFTLKVDELQQNLAESLAKKVNYEDFQTVIERKADQEVLKSHFNLAAKTVDLTGLKR
jgi:hypothetical protein